MATRKKSDPARKIVAENRRARFNYEIDDTVEAGLVLQGTEVKISETAAGLLNETFNTDAVTPGLLVGVATITIKTSA